MTTNTKPASFFSLIAPSISSLISLFLFSIGNGYINSLTSIHLESTNTSHFIIGLISSAFFAGVSIGSFIMEPFIVRIGHIRAFSVFASLLAALSILQGLKFGVVMWFIIRFLSGYCIAGLYIVIESWLLCTSESGNRGKVLACYNVALYCSQAFGQQLLKISTSSISEEFAIAGILMALSVIPLAMTRVSSPKIETPSAINLIKLWHLSSLGLVVCCLGGVMQGLLYLIMPVFMSNIGFSVSQIANSMFIIIFGAMFLQYPIGYLSDKFNRAVVVATISMLMIFLAIVAAYTAFNNIVLFNIILFFLGGFAFTAYPLGISMACDTIDTQDIVGATQGLLLVYSIGATVGPTISSSLSIFFVKTSMLAFLAITAAVMCLFSVFKIRSLNLVTIHKDKFTAVQPSATDISIEYDNDE